MENIFSSFNISSQGLGIQRQRLAAVAKNIANANTTHDADGKVYKREVVVVRGRKATAFERQMENEISMIGTSGMHAGNGSLNSADANKPVVLGNTVKDNSAPRTIFDPAHPDANQEGYVEMPNVNIVTEMVEMISAQRAFEANTSVVTSAKNVARDSLEI
jgi:flagellar basal-body rod protein FlgC